MTNNIDRQYLELVNQILRFGYDKQDRTLTGTKSIFGWQIRHSMSEGFPLITTKKMAFKTMVTELLFFLRGETNLRFLVDRNCHIWDGDAYKNYLKYTVIGVNAGLDILKGYLDNCLVEFDSYYEHFTNPSFQYGYRPLTQEEFINKIKTDDGFAKKFGDLGPIYGAQWRGWGEYGEPEFVKGIDQIANVINLLKTDPDSRRMIVNAWNVGELDQMVLPPCHMMFQFYTRELSFNERLKISGIEIDNQMSFVDYTSILNGHNIPTRAISLMWTQRSVDVGLGLPFNIASYALLLEIVAKEVNMVPEELIGSLGDCHIYNNHVDGLKEQLERIPYELPNVKIKRNMFEFGKPDPSKLELDYYSHYNFELENYQSHPAIKLPLSN